MDGKTARGASSPAKPALHIPEPLSTTRAATSSSDCEGGGEGAEEEERWRRRGRMLACVGELREAAAAWWPQQAAVLLDSMGGLPTARTMPSAEEPLLGPSSKAKQQQTDRVEETDDVGGRSGHAGRTRWQTWSCRYRFHSAHPHLPTLIRHKRGQQDIRPRTHETIKGCGCCAKVGVVWVVGQ
jgi:hypothetical protein